MDAPPGDSTFHIVDMRSRKEEEEEKEGEEGEKERTAVE